MRKYRELGIKLTPQRLAIIKFLENHKNHPSAEDIYKAVKKKYPMMSFATVYNTIEALKNSGGLLELTIDPGRKRYDPDISYHHHLICNNCKKIMDIHAEYSLDIPDHARESFEILGNHIEFYGICNDCKAKGGDK